MPEALLLTGLKTKVTSLIFRQNEAIESYKVPGYSHTLQVIQDFRVYFSVLFCFTGIPETSSTK